MGVGCNRCKGPRIREAIPCRITTSCSTLTAVELRRRIGRKDISPVELLEATIARIEALNPLLNAICATAYERARREARAAERAVRRRGARCSARAPDRHQGPARDGGAAHHLRLAALSRPHPGAGLRHGGEHAPGWRHRACQVQCSRVRGRRRTREIQCGARPAIRSILSSTPADRRRLGGGPGL